MTASLTTDLCVIGAGSGGLAVAMAAAALSVPVILVEKGEMGGQYLNSGGVPSKALIAAGRAAHIVRSAECFGLGTHEPWSDFPRIWAHLREVSGSIAPKASVARLEAMNIKVIRAAARFTSKTTIEADGATISARRFVLATGSSPAIPAIPGLEQIRSLTTESIFDLETLPAQLIVIGTERAGLELAQAFRRLGSEVTILETGKAFSDEDPELADILLVQLAREGIVLRENVEILRAEPHRSGVRVSVAGKILEETVDGSHLLVAAGRMPNVEGLGLEVAGVAFGKSGVTLGRNLRSSNRRVFAVGDVGGAPFSAAAASCQAALVVRAGLMRLPARVEPKLVPRVTFTDPEIAVAGLREEDARRRHGTIHVLRWPFAENDRALAERVPAGHIKVIASKRDVVLGVAIVGPHAGELIVPWQLAISRALKVDDMAGLVMPSPTFSEVSQRAAAAVFARRRRRPGLSRLLRAIRGFG
jgi:pyruvate/2-oxoglutarate dehydrogenase complex dihydrolipoamide dehydrogenase (E3) component